MQAPGNFETAFDRLFPLAENTAKAVVVDPTAAENIAVETLARACVRWDKVGAVGDPTAWVLRTAMALADKTGPKPVGELQAPRRSPHELLELVQRRAERLRTRRRAAIIATVAVLVAAAVTAAISLTSPSSKKVVAGPASTTTEFTFPPFDSTTLAPATTVDTTPTTLAAAPTSVAPSASTTTSTSLPCRNSTDARCGAFRWDPAPGANQAMVIDASFTPQNPHPGDVVTFTVHAVDPDASPIMSGDETCNPPGFGDVGTSRCAYTCSAPGHGPWTTPPRQRGERTVTYTHTYEDTGTFTAHFWFGSGGGCSKTPYASAADLPLTVNVT